MPAKRKTPSAAAETAKKANTNLQDPPRFSNINPLVAMAKVRTH